MLSRVARRIRKRKFERALAVAACDHFFFYGSLMERFDNFNRYLKKRVCSVEIGYCQGYLYNLPMGFPGLVTPQEPCPTLVAGEIMRFHNPQRIMRILDRLEGYNAANEKKSIYLRRKITLLCEEKTALGEERTIDAWVYIYPEYHLSYEHRQEVQIECGQWRAFNGSRRALTAQQGAFNPLNYCADEQKVIIATTLRQEPLFSNQINPPSCHKLCKNSSACGWKKPAEQSTHSTTADNR